MLTSLAPIVVLVFLPTLTYTQCCTWVLDYGELAGIKCVFDSKIEVVIKSLKKTEFQFKDHIIFSIPQRNHFFFVTLISSNIISHAEFSPKFNNQIIFCNIDGSLILRKLCNSEFISKWKVLPIGIEPKYVTYS